MIFVLGPTNIAFSITLIKMTVNFSGELKNIYISKSGWMIKLRHDHIS